LQTDRLRQREIHDQPPREAAVQMRVTQYAAAPQARAGLAEIHREPARLTLGQKIRSSEKPEWL
jgi:hypothetical protein